MPPTGLIFNIQKFSLHDGPGIRTTVFLKGCPLECRWCHNPESQSGVSEPLVRPDLCTGCAACAGACHRGAIRVKAGRAVTDPAVCVRCGDCLLHCPREGREICGREASVEEIVAEILQDRVFYDRSGGGVTFSGGEAMAQIDFLEAALAACRREGIHTALDTSGAVPWGHFERILPCTDLFLYDLKIMDEALHRRFTGVSNRDILENLRRLSEAKAEILIRVPVVPGITDDAENLDAMADFLRTVRFQRVHLLPYHAMGEGKAARLGREFGLKGLEAPAPEAMEKIRERFAAAGVETVVGG